MHCNERTHISSKTLQHLQLGNLKGASVTEARVNADTDPDACQIAPKMLWTYHIVGINHFAECCENLPATMRNAPKMPYSAMVREQ